MMFLPEEYYYYTRCEDLFQVRVHEPATPVAEAVVHRLWKEQAFDHKNLRTTSGLPLTLLHPGILNRNSGPDFQHTRLAMDELVWTGAVEIHVYSKYWYQHKHHEDPAYNSTILHVTLFKDEYTGTLTRQDGSVLPEVVLYPLLKSGIRSLVYSTYNRDRKAFPCEAQWQDIPEHIKITWIKKLARKRTAFRKAEIERMFLQTPNYEEVLHQQLFKGLGLDKNGDAMLELARRIPLRISNQLDHAFEIEALHFGVAGLLPDYKEIRLLPPESASYVDRLHDEYNRLQKHFRIPVMRAPMWLFFRLRPANFPTLRIAQAASWLNKNGLLYHDPVGLLMAALQAQNSIETLYAALQSQPSSFWHTHYRFHKKTRPHPRKLGSQRLLKLTVNCVAPLFLQIAEQTQNPTLEQQVHSLMNKLPAEQDSIIRLFKRNGFTPKNSVMSQGLHELYSMYCKPVHCLQCDIGSHILHHTL